MFTELQEKLEDFGYDENIQVEGKKLTADNGAEGDGRVQLAVEIDDEETVKVSISHFEGEWKATFHTNETQYDNLAETIATEFQYWCEV